MNRALAALALAIAMPAHAGLYCRNVDLNSEMTWANDRFTYFVAGGLPTSLPGAPDLAASNGTGSYCYADGDELAYIQEHLAIRTRTAPHSLQNRCGCAESEYVFWTGQDAIFIWNNL